MYHTFIPYALPKVHHKKTLLSLVIWPSNVMGVVPSFDSLKIDIWKSLFGAR
jgi:hypothetical protein